MMFCALKDCSDYSLVNPSSWVSQLKDPAIPVPPPIAVVGNKTWPCKTSAGTRLKPSLFQSLGSLGC